MSNSKLDRFIDVMDSEGDGRLYFKNFNNGV